MSSKVTKQDRIVQHMLDQAAEHLHELKTLEANVNNKESDVEVWAQSFLKNCLGYTALAGYSIRSQEAKGKMRPDLVVNKNDKPLFIIEVKRLGFDLSKSDFRSGKVQLAQYLSTVGNVKWGMLTNGVEWKLYDFSNPAVGGVEIAYFDIKEENETYDLNKKIVEETCYTFMDFHETSYTSETWPVLSKEATAFSPESIAKAILSADVIKYIAKTIRGEHEYKANVDMLTDRVYYILQEGLNDVIPDWNDTKIAEYQKYVKAQKRVSHRARKAVTKKEVAAAETPAPVSVVEPVAVVNPVETPLTGEQKEISLVGQKVG